MSPCEWMSLMPAWFWRVTGWLGIGWVALAC